MTKSIISNKKGLLFGFPANKLVGVFIAFVGIFVSLKNVSLGSIITAVGLAIIGGLK